MSRKDKDSSSSSSSSGLDFSDSMIALAFVDAAGNFINNRGFISSTHVGPGVYRLRLANPPPNILTDMCFGVSGGGGATMEGANLLPPDTIEILTFNAAGVPTDIPFCIKVWDVTKVD